MNQAILELREKLDQALRNMASTAGLENLKV